MRFVIAASVAQRARSFQLQEFGMMLNLKKMAADPPFQ
jgi:hypothetical protein